MSAEGNLPAAPRAGRGGARDRGADRRFVAGGLAVAQRQADASAPSRRRCACRRRPGTPSPSCCEARLRRGAACQSLWIGGHAEQARRWLQIADRAASRRARSRGRRTAAASPSSSTATSSACSTPPAATTCGAVRLHRARRHPVQPRIARGVTFSDQRRRGHLRRLPARALRLQAGVVAINSRGPDPSFADHGP